MLDAEARARTATLAACDAPVEQRRIRLHDPRSDRRGPTADCASFPADGAGGEGFTNAAESLTDNHADAVHALSEFGQGHRRPCRPLARWISDSARAKRGAIGPTKAPPGCASSNAGYAADGRLAFPALPHGHGAAPRGMGRWKISVAEVAAKEKLNSKYLQVLWQTLTDKTTSDLLDRIRDRWRVAGEKDVAPLAVEIADWQEGSLEVCADRQLCRRRSASGQRSGSPRWSANQARRQAGARSKGNRALPCQP